MLVALKQWVHNIAVFIIFYSIVKMVMPKTHYRKYVELILGLIFIIIVASPLINVMGMDNMLTMNIVKQELKISEASLKENQSYLNTKQQEIIEKEYKDLLREQLKRLVEEEGLYIDDYTININKEQGKYGELEGIKLVLTDVETEGSIHGIDEIEEITIQVNEKKKEPDLTPVNQEKQLLASKVESMIADYYGMNKDGVQVQLIGKGE